MGMPLETIKDFDLGVGSNFTLSQRVSSSPRDVSKPERDFILWLMLEQEFCRAKLRQALQHRTQTDGISQQDLEDEDDGGGDDDNLLTVDRNVAVADNEKIRIAKEFADETLRAAGITLTFQDLSERHRHSMLIQLCRSCELISGVALKSAPDVFRQLSISKFRTTFNVVKELGKGGYGEVFHVLSKVTPGQTPQEYAVKKTSVSLDSLVDLEDELNLALNESKFLKILKGHKHIVQLYDYWLEIEHTDNNTNSSSDDESGYDELVGPLKFYIQLEFCGESLEVWKEKHGKELTIRGLLLISYQIFEALAHIHKNDIMHLDINPKNILWKDSTYQDIKIVDFGLAVKGTICNDKRGTHPYVAPDRKMTPKSDVYSAAVTIVDIGKKVQTKHELNDIIKTKDIFVGADLLDDLLLKSIDAIPGNRPTSSEVATQLFNSTDFSMQ